MTYIQLNEMENKESYRQQQENELEVIQVSLIKILPSYYGSSAWYIFVIFQNLWYKSLLNEGEREQMKWKCSGIIIHCSL